MHYSQCKSIAATSASAWLIEERAGRKFLALWHPKATIEEVIESHKRENPHVYFKVTAIAVGKFQLNTDVPQTWYANDGRKVDQGMEVSI